MIFKDALSIVTIIAAMFALLASHSGLAETTIALDRNVPFTETLSVKPAVRTKCRLQTNLPVYISKYSKKMAQIDDNAAESAAYLKMEISDVRTAGGGLFSGPKWMEVKGTLINDGVAGPSFRAKRVTTKGATACRAAGACAKAIAQDISAWLKDPVDGAQLGDARDNSKKDAS